MKNISILLTLFLVTGIMQAQNRPQPKPGPSPMVQIKKKLRPRFTVLKTTYICWFIPINLGCMCMWEVIVLIPFLGKKVLTTIP